MTNVDKALLLAEWNPASGGETGLQCIVCRRFDKHGPECVLNLALSERGFYTQEERDRAREFLHGKRTNAPTLPPKDGP
jgi:hypothetical protein